MKELFLVCALALVGSNYHGTFDEENQRRIEQVREMHKFIKKHYPGAEIWIGPTPPEAGYEKTPFLWRDRPIWIKRPPINDRRAA